MKTFTTAILTALIFGSALVVSVVLHDRAEGANSRCAGLVSLVAANQVEDPDDATVAHVKWCVRR